MGGENEEEPPRDDVARDRKRKLPSVWLSQYFFLI